jgi:O-antigen/teichoic acid export membrane protein
VAGTSAVAHDVVLVMLNPDYLLAWRVMPIVALGVACQGVYLLTSIGLNLTSRTEFYPVATFAAAAVGLGGGVVLMSQFGVMGAAAAFLLSYLTQAIVAFLLARRFYTINYERARIARIVLSAVTAAACGVWLVPPMRPILGVLVRGGVTTGVFAALLWLSGFFRPTERAFLREMTSRLRRRTRQEALPADVD